MSELAHGRQEGLDTREMTVAHIREEAGGDQVDVIFLESARFYSLPRAHPAFDRLLALLRDAKDDKRAVMIRLASPESDVIEDVK